MAKEGKGINLYLLAIVCIVAIVGIVMLVLNIGSSGTISLSSDDVSGQAVKIGGNDFKPGFIIFEKDDCLTCPNNLGEEVCGDVKCSTSG